MMLHSSRLEFQVSPKDIQTIVILQTAPSQTHKMGDYASNSQV